MKVKKQIQNLIYKATGVKDVVVEKPKDANHGDYSTNIALILAKKQNKNPLEVAKKIVGKIKSDIFEKIEVSGPGFINFHLPKEFFVESIKKIDKNFGMGSHAKGYKVMVEHTQPNPFKLFHIGHLMNNAIGESVARIIKANGATVKTVSYHGDVGLHVAKTVWGIIKMDNQNFLKPGEQNKFLGMAYTFGNQQYEEDENAKSEIIELNKKIFERSDNKINKIYDQGKKWSLKYFEKIYKRLGSKFDYHFYESEAGEIGKKLVLKNVGKIFEKGEQGAIVFKGQNFEPKTHTRVFINSEGFPTYEGKEVGLAKIKKDTFNYDSSITITANEQNSFFNVVEVAIGEVFPKLKGKMRHLSHGLLKLPSGKMSSRTGTVISAEELISQIKEKVLTKTKDRSLGDEAVEKIAIGAIKYSILKQSIGSDIIYDFEKSISFEGDSGPYLQYSFARANSVLKKAKSEKVKSSFRNIPNEVGNLEKLMRRFPEVVEEAGEKYEPHIVSTYLIELAREFNNYYAKNKIVDRSDEFSPYRVALTEAFCAVMKNGLWLLGISSLNKM